MKAQLGDRDRQIGDRDAKIEGLQKDIKKVMNEKADKDCLIKSKKKESVIFKILYSIDLRELAIGK